MNYPRPQLVRKHWQRLEGEWLINGAPGLVPSCRSEEQLEYEKHFEHKNPAGSKRCILHFEGADQIAEVYLNGSFVGKHIGGYLPFSFDISKQLIDGDNVLKVLITYTLDHTYPYGKQRKDRGGMWYTPVSGLWKSVWLEDVPQRYIENVKITPDLKGANLEISIVTEEGNLEIKKQRIDVENPELWTPENPKLYYQTIIEGEDEAEIYFALRTIGIQNIKGINRVCLNGKPVFLHGVLDQGYYMPGIMTPEEGALGTDVAFLKSLGFNTIRKHIKIEPEEFYYECDKQGMLVMQDFVNSGDYKFFRDTVLGTIGFPINDKTSIDERKEFFIQHSKDTVKHLYNHPSIIAYTIFNEGWGQFNSDEMYNLFKSADPGRLYDSTSGWFKQNNSDFDSKHIYFRLEKLHPKNRPLFITECGGYSLNLNAQKASYGYGACKNREDLTDKIEKLYSKMIIPAINSGCCGCIYTQVSDIEDEINGLISYDRKTVKVISERIKEVSSKIYKELNRCIED